MKQLETFEAINLPGIMLEHLHRIMTVKNGKHEIADGYLLNKVFNHFSMPLGRGVLGTIKQTFSMVTLIECECVEGKIKAKSHVFELFEKQEALKREMEDFTVILGDKEVEIARLKALLQQAQSQGSGTSTNENEEVTRLRDENARLTESNPR
ncbi:hypothetical protein KY290_013695 [Solanum tuberosum]|uniref:Uncharacterized protein n=1 Tax=Solanum tuberosum TaxID=4113 RepID=A0ABQ7VMH5_SOLTU|nr:hypothetical protein KY289_013812 [Solanum tuberosum]KAH0769714.1 hypothetical protein KY290_013695 [Solanum tuberosum]